MKLHMHVLIALGLGLKRNWHIFFGLIAGVLVGIFLHSNGNPAIPAIVKLLEIIGQLFIRLIQMVVIPLVISAIIIGITSVGDNKQLGKFGKKMILYYGIITIAAVTIGTLLALVFHPGTGAAQHIAEAQHIEQGAQYVVQTTQDIQKDVVTNINAGRGHLTQLFVEFIPKNPLNAVAHGNMIQIIVFSLMFAIALAKVGDVNRSLVSFFESVFAATMKITDWIMFFAAPGVFALTASTIAKTGVTIFGCITNYILVLILGFAIQLFMVYPIFLRIFSKVPISMLYAAISEAMMVAFGTASSSATLPLTIACCEKRGISHKVSSFVLPLGATLNMDGTALLQVVAVLFLLQAYCVPLTPLLILQIALLAIVASSTSAGIPGAGIITIALILDGLGLSTEQLILGFTFILTIDRITDMMRTLVNVTSDAVVAAAIADNENEINYDLLTNPSSYNEIL